MMRQNIQHLHAFLFAVLLDFMAKDILLARLVSAIAVSEATAALRLVNAPTGTDFGQFGHVFLRVAAINTQRVQLHDFARIVFVQPTGPVLLLFVALLLLPPRKSAVVETAPGTLAWPINGQLRIRPHALPVVQVEQHGRALRRAYQQVFEFSQHVRTDHITLVSRDHVPVRAFADKNVEVVVPEVGHDLFKLAVAIDGAQQLGLGQFAPDYNLRLDNRLHGFTLLWLHAIDQLHALFTTQRAAH